MTYFNLFSNILVTRGISRVLISDLQRNSSVLYPLELFEIIEELKVNSIEELLENYNEASNEIAQEYLNILVKEEYGLITKNDWDKNFIPLDLEFYEYAKISNVVVETAELDVLERLKDDITNLGIRHLVINSYEALDIDKIIAIDQIFENTSLEGIEIFTPFFDNISKSKIKKINESISRIYSLVFYGCSIKPFKINDEFKFKLSFTEDNITLKSCGKVNLDYFNTNLPKVLEAINHNSCLHKKIAIDKDGNIKNCPSMPQSFGNIKDTTLEEALNHKDFKKYWNLTKDQIEVCKDCEFRYICTDCRAYTERTHENKNGLDTSKPLKCGYSPYTGEWEEWSTNSLKEKAIQYYGMQDLVKQDEK